MLTHGGQNAISLILGCCLRGDRPVVLVEYLSYPGFRYAARLARAEVVGLYLHAFTSNLVSAAVRFVPLGQNEGQRVLAALHGLIAELAAEAAEMMETHRINQLLVTDREGRLIGALNTHDLMLAKVI